MEEGKVSYNLILSIKSSIKPAKSQVKVNNFKEKRDRISRMLKEKALTTQNKEKPQSLREKLGRSDERSQNLEFSKSPNVNRRKSTLIDDNSALTGWKSELTLDDLAD
jgi:hypothetical protein